MSEKFSDIKDRFCLIVFVILFFINSNSYSQDTLVNGYILFYVGVVDDVYAYEQTANDFFVFDLPSKVDCFTEYLKKDSIIISFPNIHKCKEKKCYHHFDRDLFYKFNDSINSRVKIMKVSYYGRFYNPYDSLTSKDSLLYRKRDSFYPFVSWDCKVDQYVPKTFVRSLKFFKVSKVIFREPLSEAEVKSLNLHKPRKMKFTIPRKQSVKMYQKIKKYSVCEQVIQFNSYWEISE